MGGRSHDLSAVYDDFAATYAYNRGAFDISAVLESFAELLPAVGDLLDLGCGAGEPVASRFLGQGWRVTGVDSSAGMLALAQTYAPGMRAVRCDMRDAAFPDNSFDAVAAVYSLFHVPAGDHPALFTRIRRWLRPGGSALFTYATADYTGHDTFDGEIEFMGRRLFYSHVTPARMKEQVREAGLEVVALDERDIGGETFLWVTARRPLA